MKNHYFDVSLRLPNEERGNAVARVSDWAKKVDVMTSRLTILDVSNLCPDVAVNEFP
jgi:hypothetical protein